LWIIDNECLIFEDSLGRGKVKRKRERYVEKEENFEKDISI